MRGTLLRNAYSHGRTHGVATILQGLIGWREFAKPIEVALAIACKGWPVLPLCWPDHRVGGGLSRVNRVLPSDFPRNFYSVPSSWFPLFIVGIE